jgi:hypothetical protein
MPEHTVIRAEATEALADILSPDRAMVTMQTKEGRFAIYMSLDVFAALFREMQHVLDEASGSTPSQTNF